jgi:hypothetical protein
MWHSPLRPWALHELWPVDLLCREWNAGEDEMGSIGQRVKQVEDLTAVRVARSRPKLVFFFEDEDGHWTHREGSIVEPERW